MPAEIKGAELHTFDRFCYYNSLRTIANLPVDDINAILNHLRLALALDSVYDFTTKDLELMLGTEDFQVKLAEYNALFTEITNRSI